MFLKALKTWIRTRDYKMTAQIFLNKKMELLEMKNIKIGTKNSGLNRLDMVEEHIDELKNWSEQSRIWLRETKREVWN